MSVSATNNSEAREKASKRYSGGPRSRPSGELPVTLKADTGLVPKEEPDALGGHAAAHVVPAESARGDTRLGRHLAHFPLP